MLVAENVTYSYWGQEKPAVREAGVRVSPGSIVALVGPNGAGKTTLILCLAGLFEPHAGRIDRHGADVRDGLRRHRARTGFLSEHYGLYSGLTARQSMEYAAQSRAGAFPELRSPAARKEAIEQVAEECMVADLLDKDLDTLSRGQRQLLAMAEVEVSRPPLLLLDEPASGLDPDHREQLAARLEKLREGGRAILVSSHILAELEEYATDLVVMQEGATLPQQSGLPPGSLRDVYRRLRDEARGGGHE
ncbi:MAG: ABC transporter ATP-binding protein [Gammaproteobacteria bacterium]|nr:ABC transporter ATP-binding protein [Gammaproteobacteria bacterium]